MQYNIPFLKAFEIDIISAFPLGRCTLQNPLLTLKFCIAFSHVLSTGKQGYNSFGSVYFSVHVFVCAPKLDVTIRGQYVLGDPKQIYPEHIMLYTLSFDISPESI